MPNQSLWAQARYYLFRIKRLQVTVFSKNDKPVEKFFAKRMSQGPKNRVFVLMDGLEAKISNELPCVVKEVWELDGKILKD